jgi:uncharacterized OB-fold protein
VASVRDDDFFWEGAAAGRLLVQRCAGCGLVRHPPAPMCARCQSLEAEAVQCSGRATVLDWVVSRHPTRPDDHPRIVARLALPEGVSLISNLQGAALEEIYAGMPVEVFFEVIGGKALPQFRPAAGA